MDKNASININSSKLPVNNVQLLCELQKDYSDIKMSEIHLSKKVLRRLDVNDEFALRSFFGPVFPDSLLVHIEINKEKSTAFIYTSDSAWKAQFYRSINEKEENAIKIFAKPGTKLEEYLKEFYDIMEREKEDAIKILTELAGMKPTNWGYYCYGGYTCMWSCDFLQFPEGCKPSNMVPFEHNGQVYFKLDGNEPAVKKFIKKWCTNLRGVNGRVLMDYIPDALFVHWLPCHENNRYGIEVPSIVREKMVGRIHEQCEIE